ncbi:NCS2 family permease, partial [Alphaproteobacteria bacterium]|nr:NCS2 family permease [Alphaproteobacteria bacterium]
MLENFFALKKHNTSVRTEIIAGISTFFTLAFIIAVNPAILSDAGIDFAAGFVATIIASAFGCFIIGIWAGWPVAIAPGMGLNAYFAYVVVLGHGFTWQQALAAVFVSSVLFFLFSLSKARSWLILSIPKPLQSGITAGIGTFLAIIGLTSAGIIVDNPDTLVGMGDLTQAPILLSLVGLIVMAGLSYRGITGSILFSILAISIIGWIMGLAEFGGLYSMPPVASAAFSLDFSQIASAGFLSVVFVMFFVDFFDTTGTLTAIADPAKLRQPNGEIKNLNRAVLADT